MKRPLYEKIVPPANASFFMVHYKFPDLCNVDFWHFHPEYEIVYVPAGNGKRFIGNQISRFEDGDLILLGPNIPHNTFYFGFESENYEEYVIQFKGKLVEELGKHFVEFESLKSLLEEAHAGQFITGKAKHSIGLLIRDMMNMEPFDKLMTLLKVLEQMAHTHQRKSLHVKKYISVSVLNTKRVQEVYAIIQKNFHTDITTRQVAGKLAMTESSFCRFFVQSTGKTFKQALTEVRIQQACSLLKNSQATIGAVAANCGFNNISLFNRFFKSIVKETPNNYRRQFNNKVRAC
jgi:AraC-like DNA-binding protein